jgi:uncharacterized membrane protein YeaQ/YmgE (transglycosylase-associated protein family)
MTTMTFVEPGSWVPSIRAVGYGRTWAQRRQGNVMSDGMLWVLVGALVPLVWFSLLKGPHKVNFLVLMALGVAGAVVGGPIGEMFRPEADVWGAAGMLGAAIGSIAFTMTHRLVTNLLNTTARQDSPFDAPREGARAQRARTI